MPALIPLSFWAASGAGGASASAAYELISTTVLSSAAASVTFSGLGTSAAAYKHLQIRYAGFETAGGGIDALRIRFNTDAGTNYSIHSLTGINASVASGSLASQTFMTLGFIGGNGYTSNPGAGIVDILDFSNTSKNKTIRSLSGTCSSIDKGVALYSGAWLSTAAITSFNIYGGSGNIDTNTRISLYGLKG